jgi:hypothetical protein
VLKGSEYLNPFGSVDRIASQAAKRIEGMVSAFRKKDAGWLFSWTTASESRPGWQAEL